MKYIVLLCDGLADRPIKELNNKTIIIIKIAINTP